ncbi:MAG: hypothetical protein ABI596_10745 [Pyrinomonadaceae bacterium]
MRNPKRIRSYATRLLSTALLISACQFPICRPAQAASWGSIQPLKSRRAEVERLLGKPVNESSAGDSTLHYNVSGGNVTVSFVTAKFVATKKLSPDLEGTVLLIVLQHERSSDTPDSMGLPKNRDFDRQGGDDVAIYSNMKDGIVYTFIGGKLKTSRYSASSDELLRARK